MTIRMYNGLNTGSYIKVAIVVSAIILSAAFFVFAATPARAASFNVDISDLNPTLFTPQVLTINVGDTVVWTCNGEEHSTSSNNGQTESWNSPPMSEVAPTFSHTFSTTGNFSYVSLAPADAGEVGYIVVKQPTPEFPGYMLYITLAAAVILALLIERRLRA